MSIFVRVVPSFSEFSFFFFYFESVLHHQFACFKLLLFLHDRGLRPPDLSRVDILAADVEVHGYTACVFSLQPESIHNIVVPVAVDEFRSD